MSTQHQPDKLIATYQIFGFFEDGIATDPTPSSSSAPSDLTIPNKETISIDSTRYPITSLTPIGSSARHTITIHEPSQKIQNINHHTHVAHITLGRWVGDLLCSYDAPAGILHNARVADMNPVMKKATGWRWQDDEKPLTREQDLEEQRAVIKYGIYKRPRSKTIALCTLKANDEAGWKYLELRAKRAAVREQADPKAAKNRMVSFVARKVVADGAQSTPFGVMIPKESTQNDGAATAGDGKTEDEGGARELERCKSFAELLRLLQDRVVTVATTKS